LHRGWEFEFAGNLYFPKLLLYIIVARYGEYNDELTCEKFYLVRHSCTEDGNSSSRGKLSKVGSLPNCRFLSQKSAHYQIKKKKILTILEVLTSSGRNSYRSTEQLLHCVLDPHNSFCIVFWIHRIDRGPHATSHSFRELHKLF